MTRASPPPLPGNRDNATSPCQTRRARALGEGET